MGLGFRDLQILRACPGAAALHRRGHGDNTAPAPRLGAQTGVHYGCHGCDCIRRQDKCAAPQRRGPGQLLASAAFLGRLMGLGFRVLSGGTPRIMARRMLD